MLLVTVNGELSEPS